MTDISKYDDLVDSRDVIARIDELEMEIDALVGNDVLTMDQQDELEVLRAELKVLEDLQSECEDYSDDWGHGCTLIRESYWVDYCKELLEDCGELPRDLPRYIVIDWDATANNVKVDYTEVTFDGVPYLVR
jgi:hypothetical protein